MSFLICFAGGVLAHAVFDVVVDDEVEFFVGEAVMLRQYTVDLIDDRLGHTRIDALDL